MLHSWCPLAPVNHLSESWLLMIWYTRVVSGGRDLINTSVHSMILVKLHFSDAEGRLLGGITDTFWGNVPCLWVIRFGHRVGRGRNLQFWYTFIIHHRSSSLGDLWIFFRVVAVSILPRGWQGLFWDSFIALELTKVGFWLCLLFGKILIWTRLLKQWKLFKLFWY